MASYKLQVKQTTLKKVLKNDLLRWICEKHATNSHLDRQIVRNKALEISQSLGLTDFKCSEQWVTSFLKKFGFSTSLTTYVGPYFKDYRLWIDLMRALLTQYKYKDLFHADELNMYSDILPMNVDLSQRGNVHDYQDINATNPISILLCCNASGTDKLPPLISGSYKSRILREDCKYCYNENSCINDEVFADWLFSLNQMMSQKDRKILLLLNRYRIRALGNTQLSNVSFIFFPDDFPLHLRPLRRDVFHCVKMKYRLRYAEKIVKPESKWGVEEMIDAVVKSWSEVPQELIVSSFQRTTFRSDDCILEISSTDWDQLSTGISFKRLITFDDHLSDVPHSTSDSTKQVSRTKHNYNLRTSCQELIQLEDSNEKLEYSRVKEKKYRKTEDELKLTPRKGMRFSRSRRSSSAEDINLNEDRDSYLEKNVSIDFIEEDKFENNLTVEENLSKNLDINNKRGRNSPGIRDSNENQAFKDVQICSVDENQEIIDCHQIREGGVDKQIERLDSSQLVQIGQLANVNADLNRLASPIEKINNFTLGDDEDEPPEKIKRVDNDWSEQYKSICVFGPNQQILPGPSTINSNQECIVECCVIKDSQKKNNKTKLTGSSFIFTKTGSARDRSCSPKE